MLFRSGLLRGDAKSRSEFYMRMFGVGALSPNEIRSLEEMNPVENGDHYYVPANYRDPDEPVRDVPAAPNKGNEDDKPV